MLLDAYLSQIQVLLLQEALALAPYGQPGSERHVDPSGQVVTDVFLHLPSGNRRYIYRSTSGKTITITPYKA